MVIIIYLF